MHHVCDSYKNQESFKQEIWTYWKILTDSSCSHYGDIRTFSQILKFARNIENKPPQLYRGLSVSMSITLFGLISLFDVISTFMGYLIPKTFL